MKKGLVFILFFTSLTVFSQLKPGFEAIEARDMIAICNSFTYMKVFGSDQKILPKNYQKTFTSDVIGMDNMFQVYIGRESAVLNFRGSTNQKTSWLENAYFAMILANGEISINDTLYQYCFSKDSLAAVHGGYALAVVFMHQDIIEQINKINKKGVFDIILTGHSQGGALSQMFRAFLEFEKGRRINANNNFKTYAFASPKIGNLVFTDEYNKNYCNGWSFNVVNPKDMVPTLPLSYSNEILYTRRNMVEMFAHKDSAYWKGRVLDDVIRRFAPELSTVVNRVGSMMSKEISKDVAKVKMPNYVREINYGVLAELIEIAPVDYPLVLKDSSLLVTDSLTATYPVDENGFFINKKLYKDETRFYQHKPYNYYVSILKQFFPEEYESLNKKCDVCD